MTYCIAVRLDHGLVFISDTRTNAGVDNVGTYRKLHVFSPAPDRMFVLQSAGNLATTQEVLDRIRRDLADPDARLNLATVEHLFEAALYVGALSQEVMKLHAPSFENPRQASATFIVGGQVGDEASDILLVYPEGNYIRASDERPFLQIGESKYGKYMLEIGIHSGVDFATGLKVVLSSMMSASRANVSVGPPYDIGIYEFGSHELQEFRVPPGSPALARLERFWGDRLRDLMDELPPISPDDFGSERD
ncbi:MAG: 20S proteasome subunit A/B [Actinomycetota bacterium]|nr:20S proteasome subunit A/B [Actinomycetota bacterium]